MERKMEQRTQEWFEARKGRITASSVGAILGLSPFMKREEVMRRMVRDWHGAEPEFKGNAATEWGERNESEALDAFFLATGISPIATGFHEHSDWGGASPDGLIGEDALIEIKCPYGLRNMAAPEFKSLSELPNYYAQVQFQLFCTGRTLAYFFQWAKNGTSVETVKADEAWVSENIPKLKAFYDGFLDEIGNDVHLEPKVRKLSTFASRKLVWELDDIAEQIKALEERKNKAIQQLEYICGGEKVDIDGRIFQKVTRSGSVNYAKALKDLAPGADLKGYVDAPTEYWHLSKKKE